MRRGISLAALAVSLHALLRGGERADSGGSRFQPRQWPCTPASLVVYFLAVANCWKIRLRLLMQIHKAAGRYGQGLRGGSIRLVN